jgi:hypothetical protein
MLKKIDFRIKGVCTLIVHNGMLADPLYPFTKQIKTISSKRKKTDQDYQDLADLEWRGGLYLNDKLHPIMPGANIQAMLIEGAKKDKRGNDFKAGVFVEEDPEIIYDGPKDIEELAKNKNFSLRAPVVINNSRIIRTRPCFPNWELEFTVSYNTTILNADDVKQALEKGGRQAGLGTWTPMHGRFEIV